jgi:hypothetical protein
MPKKEEPIDGEGKVPAACFFGRIFLFLWPPNLQRKRKYAKEDIASNTTCWCFFFGMKPQHAFLFA